MDLTVRSYNCLKREGIHTVGELVSRTEADLLDIRNFGQKSIDEVKIKLAGMGLSLKDSPAGFDPAAAALAYSDNDWNDDTDDSGYGASARRRPGDRRRRHRLRGDRADLICSVTRSRCGTGFAGLDKLNRCSWLRFASPDRLRRRTGFASGSAGLGPPAQVGWAV